MRPHRLLVRPADRPRHLEGRPRRQPRRPADADPGGATPVLDQRADGPLMRADRTVARPGNAGQLLRLRYRRAGHTRGRRHAGHLGHRPAGRPAVPAGVAAGQSRAGAAAALALPRHWADPRLAWPAAARRALPGAPGFAVPAPWSSSCWCGAAAVRCGGWPPGIPAVASPHPPGCGKPCRTGRSSAAAPSSGPAPPAGRSR